MKEAKHRRTTTVLFQLYEVCRLVKFTEMKISIEWWLPWAKKRGDGDLCWMDISCCLQWWKSSENVWYWQWPRQLKYLMPPSYTQRDEHGDFMLCVLCQNSNFIKRLFGMTARGLRSQLWNRKSVREGQSWWLTTWRTLRALTLREGQGHRRWGSRAGRGQTR